MKKVSPPYIYNTTKNNLEITKTSPDIRKAPSINYVIDNNNNNNNNNKRKIFEKKQELLENAGKVSHVGSHCDVRKACE